MKPQGMGYRNRSELTPNQANMMHDAYRSATGLKIESASEVRTAHSLIKREYATWNEDERILFLTVEGIDWCQHHDRHGRIG